MTDCNSIAIPQFFRRNLTAESTALRSSLVSSVIGIVSELPVVDELSSPCDNSVCIVDNSDTREVATSLALELPSRLSVVPLTLCNVVSSGMVLSLIVVDRGMLAP